MASRPKYLIIGMLLIALAFVMFPSIPTEETPQEDIVKQSFFINRDEQGNIISNIRFDYDQHNQIVKIGLHLPGKQIITYNKIRGS